MKKDVNNKEELVSIIMPTYNSEDYIEKTINSVEEQSYTNWELLIVDDCSKDRTTEIIERKMQTNPRIFLKRLGKNSGAAIARNTAVEKAKGTYLAFLDSDDLWLPDKLSKQIRFMENNNYVFTSTSFLEVEEETQETLGTTQSHEKLDYEGVLKYCPGNSTVIYNAKELGKFYMPDIKRRNDFAMWLQVIKKAKYLYGMKEPLTIYRVREGSLSKDKSKLVKYQWKVYREIEGLSILKSTYLLMHKVFNVITK